MIAPTMRIVLLIVVLASIGCYFRVLRRDTKEMAKFGSFDASVEV